MSFQYLENPRSGGHASKQQPKQRRDEESTFERNIKVNIQQMQESIRKAADQLDSAQRSYTSRRIGESLDKALERSRELSQETEGLFRDWTVHLVGEPTERHRKKFSFEKLQRAFEDEVEHLKDVARRAVAAQQEALSAEKAGGLTAMEFDPVCEEQGSSMCGEDVEHGLLSHEGQACRVSALQEDAQIRNRIAQEREEGIRRIQTQVSEVNQIFRDLATIVQEQGQQFETIENQAEAASTSTKQTVGELKKAVNRQKSSRERLCCMLAGAVLLLCFIILPHMHGLQLRHSEAMEARAAGDFGVGAGEQLPPGFSSAADPTRPFGSAEVVEHTAALSGSAAALPPTAPPLPTGRGAGSRAEPVVVSKTGRSLA